MAEGRPLSPAPGSRLPGPPLLLGLAALVLLGAACGPATPVPPPESLLAPKQLATVVLSPTPVSTPVVPPTPTRAAPRTLNPTGKAASPQPTTFANEARIVKTSPKRITGPMTRKSTSMPMTQKKTGTRRL